jgi:CHAT domain-containing protein
MLRLKPFRVSVLTLAALISFASVASLAQTPQPQATPSSVSLSTQAQQLAAELIAAQTEAERAALVNARRDLLSAELRKLLSERGNQLRIKGEYAQALAAHQSALIVATQLGDKEGIARALNGIGQVRFAKNDFGGAMESFKQSLAAWAAVDERIMGRAEVLTDIARIHFRKRDFKASQEFYQKALEAARATGDKEFEATALNGLGIARHYTGETEAALQFYRQSLQLAENIGNKERAGNALNNLAMLYNIRGETKLSAEAYRRSIRLYEEMGDKARLAVTFTNFANFLQVQDDYAAALRYHQLSLKLYQELGDKAGVARVLGNLSDAYFRQGDYQLALDFSLRSLALREEDKTEGNRENSSSALNGLGEIYIAMGRYDDALQSANRGLAISEATGYKKDIIAALEQIGSAYFAKGDYVAARERWEKSLRLAEQARNQDYASYQLDKLATAYLALKDYTKALETAERAAQLAAHINRRSIAWSAHNTAGKSLLALNRKAEARQAFDRAIDAIEDLRGQIVGDERGQQHFFSNKTAPYEEIVKLLVAEKSYDEALRYAERARARVLFDVLHKGRANVNKAMTDAERAQESALRGDISVLNSQLQQETARPNPDSARVGDLQKRLDKARLEHTAFQTNLYVAHPELKVQRGELPAVSAQRLAALLPDEQTALIEYAITDDRTFLFVLTKGDVPGAAASSGVKRQAANATPLTAEVAIAAPHLAVYTLKVTRAELARNVEHFRQQLAASDIRFGTEAKRLYELLLAPAAAQLENRARLIVVPDGALWELPFQALQTPKAEYVIERHAISYAPSLSVLVEIVRGRARRKSSTPNASVLLAFGDPAIGASGDRTAQALRGGTKNAPANLPSTKFAGLPEAERQVRALGELYGAARSRVYTGAEADETRLKREARRFAILHLATHGVLDNSNPMYSYVMLSGSAARTRSAGLAEQNTPRAKNQSGNSDEAMGEDGLLEAWELMELDLSARLVVLSACETARGRVTPGEGMIGLTWALFVAGSPTTVVSQWKVESASTTELMLAFHRQLKERFVPATSRKLSAPVMKAEALRRAALQLLRSEQYAHPFYWAGFVMVGDGEE